MIGSARMGTHYVGRLSGLNMRQMSMEPGEDRWMLIRSCGDNAHRWSNAQFICMGAPTMEIRRLGKDCRPRGVIRIQMESKPSSWSASSSLLSLKSYRDTPPQGFSLIYYSHDQTNFYYFTCFTRLINIITRLTGNWYLKNIFRFLHRFLYEFLRVCCSIVVAILRLIKLSNDRELIIFYSLVRLPIHRRLCFVSRIISRKPRC